MQDRYAGDIGDYGKIGLLKMLAKQGFDIGVNWYRVQPLGVEMNADGTYKQNDGKHLIPDKLRECDPALADTLTGIATGDNRSISAIQKADLIPGACYYDEPLSVPDRGQWHENAKKMLAGANLVFLDPDNGLQVKSVGERSAKSVKYAFYREVEDYLNDKKSVLIYNHRRRLPAKEYFDDIENMLQKEVKVYRYSIQAITFTKGSIRDYFAVPASREHAEMIKAAFTEMTDSLWGQHGICKLNPEWAKQLPLTYMTYDDYAFRDITCKKFDESMSLEGYKEAITRHLMIGTYNYSEDHAKSLVKLYKEYIEEAYAKKESVEDAAIEVGYCCG